MVDERIAGHWPNLKEHAPIAGSRAFAVAGDRILFRGGYEARDRCFLVSLEEHRAEEIVVVDPAGNPLSRARAVGRGTRLYLWADQGLFVVDAAALPAW